MSGGTGNAPVIPPRPESDARLLEPWLNAFSGPAGFVLARLQPSSRLRSGSPARSVINGADMSANWSGIVASPPAGCVFDVAICGVWSVPQVSSVGAGSETVSIWIGIDGYPATATSLLQAGISVAINPTGPPQYSAWAEWLTPTDQVPPQEIGNFPVQAGDSIEVQIWVTSLKRATVVMRHLSPNGAGVPVILPVGNPANAQIAGLSAEWIVERPVVSRNPITYATLPDYSTVVFTQAIAWAGAPAVTTTRALLLSSFASSHGYAIPAGVREMAAALDFPLPVSLRAMLSEVAPVFGGSGTTITMLAPDGTTLSTVDVMGEQSIQCQYAGPV